MIIFYYGQDPPLHLLLLWLRSPPASFHFDARLSPFRLPTTDSELATNLIVNMRPSLSSLFLLLVLVIFVIWKLEVLGCKFVIWKCTCSIFLLIGLFNLGLWLPKRFRVWVGKNTQSDSPKSRGVWSLIGILRNKYLSCVIDR